MNVQSDLFGAPTLPGLAYQEDLVSLEEEADLIAQNNAEDLLPFKFQRWTAKRLTRSFGWSYDFERGSFSQTDPIPDWLETLRARAARFAGLLAQDLAQVLLIRYDPGAGIGWHKDRPVFEHVIGVSLGSEARMRFRRRSEAGFDRSSALLRPRSVYHLSGNVRDHWEHSIVPGEEPRWSVTFRSLRS